VLKVEQLVVRVHLVSSIVFNVCSFTVLDRAECRLDISTIN
jgi:hypothetical protein